MQQNRAHSMDYGLSNVRANSTCEQHVRTEKTDIYSPALVRAEIRGASANGLPATRSLDDSNCIVYSAGIVASISYNARSMP